MGGSVSRYPDGQLAMRAFDNGAGHACSVSYAVLNVQITAYNFYMVAIDCMLRCQSVMNYFSKTFEPLRFHRVSWRSHRSDRFIPAYLFSLPFMAI